MSTTRVVLHFLTLVVTAAVDRLRAAARVVRLVAAPLAAVLAALAATTGVRDGVGHHVERLHRHQRIVARDDEPHALGHFSVALYRISTLKHDPGRSVAGNGLLMSFQWLLLRLKATLVTCRSQSPTLQIAIVRSPRQHSLTPPMHVDPVTTSRPRRVARDRNRLRPGRIVAADRNGGRLCAEAGWRKPNPHGHRGTRRDLNGIGRDSRHHELARGRHDARYRERARSAVEQGEGQVLEGVERRLCQSCPCWGSPSRDSGAGAVPETASVRTPARSLLKIVSVAAFAPKLAGRKRNGNATESPTPITSG